MAGTQRDVSSAFDLRPAILAGVWASIAVALLPSAASAHEVLHEVRRGQAVAVRVYYSDGEPISSTPYELYSPADRSSPHQKGRTDRDGWLAFLPDAPGSWQIKVADRSGHGLVLEVDAASPDAAPGRSGTVAPALRPLVGLLILAAIFAGLYYTYRRKGAGSRGERGGAAP